MLAGDPEIPGRIILHILSCLKIPQNPPGGTGNVAMLLGRGTSELLAAATVAHPS